MSHNKSRKKKRKEIIYVVKKPVFYKNIWFYVSVFLFFNLFIIQMVPEKKDLINKPNEEKVEKKTENSKENKPKNQNTEIDFQKELTSKKFIMKINKTGETEEIHESEFISYKSDSGKYAIVNIDIKNISDKLESINSSSFKLLFKEKKYSPSILIGLNNDYINFDTLNPDMAMKGNLVFEIPKEVSISECKLLFSDTDLFEDSIIFKLE